MSNTYIVTGLMSGSSMDGVDLACCEFIVRRQKWNYRILAAETLPYPNKLKSKLTQACNWSQEEILELDLELGSYYATLLNNFHTDHHLLPDLIASHGHTILHDPGQGITFQAGNGRIIATGTRITVVNDFRSEDVAQGGQGAPLVPVGDRLLFGSFDGCLNLGGFANISYETTDSRQIAYDLCPANMALNWIAGLEGLEFDKDGDLAGKGRVMPDFLAVLNGLNFYKTKAPKSLGREWFLRIFLPLLEQNQQSSLDLMTTVSEHIAFQIARGINKAGIGTVLVSGGGALNQTLIDRLSVKTSATIEIPDLQIIHFKEAMVFAFLGLLRFRGEINCLASVTGGRQDLSASTIHKI